MDKPFYISQLPEKTQSWIKEKTKENFLKDGMSEEEAEQKATDFLDEKVNVAEDFFGKDFYKSIDAIKDNFTPPGAKEDVKDEIDTNDDELYDQMESMGDMPSDMQLHKALKKADTNDNGEIEVDEMADFQKSLDDYASKNKKGREDIPATYKR